MKSQTELWLQENLQCFLQCNFYMSSCKIIRVQKSMQLLGFPIYPNQYEFPFLNIFTCGLAPWLNWPVLHLQVPGSHRGAGSCPSSTLLVQLPACGLGRRRGVAQSLGTLKPCERFPCGESKWRIPREAMALEERMKSGQRFGSQNHRT